MVMLDPKKQILVHAFCTVVFLYTEHLDQQTLLQRNTPKQTKYTVVFVTACTEAGNIKEILNRKLGIIQSDSTLSPDLSVL